MNTETCLAHFPNRPRKTRPMKANRDTIVYEALNNMTRTELRNLAKHLDVPRGRDKNNTEKNLAQAIFDGKAQVKIQVRIIARPIPPSNFGDVLIIKTFGQNEVITS
jgi:hypothetical protein